MNFKKCKNCGKTVPEGNYCDQCGAPIAAAATSTPIELPAPHVIMIRQVEGGDARFPLLSDTIFGRTQPEYSHHLKGYKFISGRHARISYDEDEGWSVTDLGSTNGTYVNDDCLKKDVPHPFDHGDILDFGTIIFEVE